MSETNGEKKCLVKISHSPDEMYSNVYSTKSPKPKDIQFKVIYEKEKHKILIFEMLELEPAPSVLEMLLNY